MSCAAQAVGPCTSSCIDARYIGYSGKGILEDELATPTDAEVERCEAEDACGNYRPSKIRMPAISASTASTVALPANASAGTSPNRPVSISQMPSKSIPRLLVIISLAI